MAENKKNNFENIEGISSLLGADGIGALSEKVTGVEKRVSDILKKLQSLENIQSEKKAQEKALEMAKILEQKENEEKLKSETESKAVESKDAEKPAEKIAEKISDNTTDKTAEKNDEPSQVKDAKKVEEKVASVTVDKTADEKTVKAEKPEKSEKADEKTENGEKVVEEIKTVDEKAQILSTENSLTENKEQPKQTANKTFVSNDKKTNDRPQRQYNNPQTTGMYYKNGVLVPRPQQYNTAIQEKLNANRPANRPEGGYNRNSNGSYNNNGYNRNTTGGFNNNGYNRNASGGFNNNGYNKDRNASGGFNNNGYNKDRNATGGFNRPSTGAKKPSSYVETPIIIPDKSKDFANKKKPQTYDKQYVEKKTVNKRSLIKQQVSVEDFDENKSGYRKLRVKKQKQQAVDKIKIEKAVVTTKEIPLKVLSEKLGISAVEITKKLFAEGIIKTINDLLDFDTAEYIAAGLDIELEYKPEITAEEELKAITVEDDFNDECMITRAPVVTIMGHVDHGKTSLLDKIRHTNVTGGEAGGITQHIGAYSIKVNGKPITFLDTPGHEAFTAMRARGAQVTDIVILVVAADDGIMPQTIEAINHAKAANVPIIVAVNKMDKPTANPDKVKQGLIQNGLVPEEWGGDTIMCPVSAKTGAGIDVLLENINMMAEIKDLKANPNRKANGVIIEAKLDKGKGPVATVLVQNGTLKTGDTVVSGTTVGRIRAMIDDMGRQVKSAGPSMAVAILGLEDVPNAGDTIIAVEQDKLAKLVMDERKRKESEAMVKAQSRVTLDQAFNKIAEGKIKGLNIIVKADVQGSVEAVKQSLVKLSNEEVKVNILHSGAGAITESDVSLAESSNAIVIGFNVRPDAKARAHAEHSKVDVRFYTIIYNLLDDMQGALNGMLEPKYKENYMGKCEVRETFKITGVGMVAGCYVTDGKLVRNGKLRIYRDDIMIVEGNVLQLKRFKDDVKEVAQNYECGVSIENFNEIKVGDVIECYVIEKIESTATATKE